MRTREAELIGVARPGVQTRKRLRPARAAGGERGGAAPASASAWGWGPTRIGKCWQLLALALVLTGGAACRQDMHDQPKYEPLEPGAMFSNGQSARPLVEDTVARGHLDEDEQFFTGKVNGQLADTFPYPVTADMVNRGQERFNVFCGPCHDRAGTGRGMVVRRGYRQPPSLHDQRLKDAPVGHFFDVMTNGFGAMPDYRAQVPVADRWAIIAYIRALQRTTGGGAVVAPQPAPGSPAQPGQQPPAQEQQ